MAICLIKKGGGGIQSEDTTALRSEVLAGKTALTADSNDEVVQGTMSLLDRAGFDVVNMRLAHQRTDGKGRGYVVDSPTHGRGIAVSVKPPDGKKYALDNNVELVFKSEPDLRAENIRGDKNIAGVQGSIPLWNPARSGYSDMLYAWNNKGHCIDHPVAGRGVVLKIGNGYLIENANWVFLKVPTLLPWNIRKGVNVLGVEGTLPDYSAGRVVFNGATFDNELVSGVASKGFYSNSTYFAYNLDQNYRYAGIYNGGMNFILSTGYPTLRSRRIGCVLSQSINLTPFRQIVISHRTLASIQGNPYATLEAHVNRVSTRRLIDVTGAGEVDAVDILRQGIASPAIDRTGQIVLNVADINEQAFISFGAYCDIDRPSDVFAGAVQITKIDFLN